MTQSIQQPREQADIATPSSGGEGLPFAGDPATGVGRWSGPLSLAGLAPRSTPPAIVVTDAEGRVEWINAAFTALTGFA
jgi:PAS domain-containing protein